MDERCFRPLFCTVKAELGHGQPGLMRSTCNETLPHHKQRESHKTLVYVHLYVYHVKYSQVVYAVTL